MKVYYLEMRSLDDLKPGSSGREVELTLVEPCDGTVNQRFYRDVGQAWNWKDRAAWPLDRWQDYVESEAVSTVVIGDGSREIGYSEMRNQSGDVEIVSFGLLPFAIGSGYGSAALEKVIRLAWSLEGATRVWLHTCEADHPNALNNYQRRGFRLYETQET